MPVTTAGLGNAIPVPQFT